MSDCVVDASVVVKLFLEEEGSDDARRLFLRPWTFFAPDFLIVECTNVFWKHVRRGSLSVEKATDGVDRLLLMPLSLLRSFDLIESALELAVGTGRSVYESMYIAAAISIDCPLITSDERLVNAMKSHRLAAHIRLLA